MNNKEVLNGYCFTAFSLSWRFRNGNITVDIGVIIVVMIETKLYANE